MYFYKRSREVNITHTDLMNLKKVPFRKVNHRRTVFVCGCRLIATRVWKIQCLKVVNHIKEKVTSKVGWLISLNNINTPITCNIP